MEKIQKDNVFLTVNDSELAYYRSLGFNKIGEEEIKTKKASCTKYNKLLEENEALKNKVLEFEKTIKNKDEEISTLESQIITLKSSMTDERRKSDKNG